jgi:hypothetical protein
LNRETPVFQDKGTLQQFVGQGWTQIGTGTSTIWVLQSNDTNASRIVILDNVTGSVRERGEHDTLTPLPEGLIASQCHLGPIFNPRMSYLDYLLPSALDFMLSGETNRSSCIVSGEPEHPGSLNLDWLISRYLDDSSHKLTIFSSHVATFGSSPWSVFRKSSCWR